MKNKLSFDQATEKYRLLFKRGKLPDEKLSLLRGGVWQLVSAKGALLGRVFPDGSVMSGRTCAELWGHQTTVLPPKKADDSKRPTMPMRRVGG